MNRKAITEQEINLEEASLYWDFQEKHEAWEKYLPHHGGTVPEPQEPTRQDAIDAILLRRGELF